MKKDITHSEFIDFYTNKGGLEEYKTSYGFFKKESEHSLPYIALPCNCNSGDCKGWAMIRPSWIEDHLKAYHLRLESKLYAKTFHKPKDYIKARS